VVGGISSPWTDLPSRPTAGRSQPLSSPTEPVLTSVYLLLVAGLWQICRQISIQFTCSQCLARKSRSHSPSRRISSLSAGAQPLRHIKLPPAPLLHLSFSLSLEAFEQAHGPILRTPPPRIPSRPSKLLLDRPPPWLACQNTTYTASVLDHFTNPAASFQPPWSLAYLIHVDGTWFKADDSWSCASGSGHVSYMVRVHASDGTLTLWHDGLGQKDFLFLLDEVVLLD
jgi:hypothetical protein